MDKSLHIQSDQRKAVNDNLPFSHIEVKWSYITFHAQKQCHSITPLADMKTVEQVGTLGIRLFLDDNLPLSHTEVKYSYSIFHPQKQCHCNTPLIDMKTVQHVGTLGIRLSLDDRGPRQSEDKALPSANSGASKILIHNNIYFNFF
jgi:hypothetical protein